MVTNETDLRVGEEHRPKNKEPRIDERVGQAGRNRKIAPYLRHNFAIGFKFSYVVPAERPENRKPQ